MTIRNSVLSFAAAGVLAFGVALPAQAADHTDAPGIQGAEGSFLDITDVYAFRSPANPNNLVVVVGVFSPVGGTTPPLFDNNASYQINIDSDGDFLADTTLTTTFSTNEAGEQIFQTTGFPGVVDLVGGSVSTGADASFAEVGEVKAFAGLRDDHFFFDLVGFQNFLAAPCVPEAGLRCPGGGAPQNFFAGLNAATIVVELPLVSLPNIDSPNAGGLNVWAKTFSDS